MAIERSNLSMLTFQVSRITRSIPRVSLTMIPKERFWLSSIDALFDAVYLFVVEYDVGNSLIIFAGIPAAKTFGGRLFLTREHAPITLLSPI